MQKLTFHNLVNKGELQKLQDEFCSVAGVSAYCLSADGEQVTSLSAVDGQQEIVQRYMQSAQVKTVLERVEDGSLEELAIEQLDDDGAVAALSIRADNQAIVSWVVFCSGERDLSRFELALDLLRDTSCALVAIELSYFSVAVENQRSRHEQQEMSKDLRMIEATTQIVQLLDSDDVIEIIIEKWLQILCEYLGVDTAQVFQIHGDGQQMDVLSEWRKEGLVPFFDRTSNVETFSFLRCLKPLVVSYDNFNKEYRDELSHTELKALIIFPILSGQNTENGENNGGMVLSLNHRQRAHTWRMDEVKFAADAVKVLQSILTRRIQKKTLASSYAALEAILDNVGCAIYVSDSETKGRLFANRILQNTFSAELRDNTFQKFIDAGVEQQGSGSYETCFEDKNTWYDLTYKEIAWVDGRKAMLYSLYDITDKKLYQRKIEQQAYTDFLTGLYNRMCCERDLAKQVDEAKKTGQVGAILYLDLDNFKHINDGLGHQYGDVLLKAISNALKKIEGIQNTCYRMGGDEFVIIVPPHYYLKFEKIIEDIKAIFGKPWFLKDADYYCTMSMGIVTFPDAGESVADLIKKADIAMYEAKKSGKNRCSTYRDGIDSASGRRLDMEKNMRDATVDGYREFEIYYQPIIDVEHGKSECVGAEALIRWNSEKLGFIPPAEFIPLAEYLGLINPIGNYVLREACFHCKQWNDNGYPDYKVNVNLSVVQLLQTDIVEIVERVLNDTKILPKNLTLEVTESLAINDMEKMKEILGRIKALGVRIALDDFGTGYSSLNHIREIPFDIIKVDQSFVRDLAEDAYSQSFIKMVAELGETIGVSICVEGIETVAQYKALTGMKVKYIQGFFFDRPMKRREFEEKYISAIANKEKNV
ncbi:MAG: bifunctional diguanylate cyclase/phosphodiesterase [Acetatifactor sp.]|nr:bifunctional diguanylate cyclase/phosphodiesterase [Acetatifactor sp.]